MADLRGHGRDQRAGRPRGPPLTRRVLARACELYAERFADPDGRLPATFDIITLTGWAAGRTRLHRRADRRRDGVVHPRRLGPEGGDRAEDDEEDQRDDQTVLDGRGAGRVARKALQIRSRSQATSGASAGGIG